MKKKARGADIVVSWRHNAGANAPASEPDPLVIEELARELGRMAARHAMREAQRRDQDVKSGGADLGKKVANVIG